METPKSCGGSSSTPLHLKKLVEANVLNLADVGTNRDEQLKYIDDLSREVSWIISVAIWKQLSPVSDKADSKHGSLCSLTHGLGACGIAALFAGVFAFVIAGYYSTISSKCSDWVRFFLAFFMSFLIAWLFHISYIRTARYARVFGDLVLEGYLAKQKDKNCGKPFDAYVDSNKWIF